MKSLVAKGAERWNYRFYWYGNKGEYHQGMDQWHKKLDISSFSFSCGVGSLNSEFDNEYKKVYMEVSKKQTDKMLKKEIEVVIKQKSVGVLREETKVVIKEKTVGVNKEETEEVLKEETEEINPATVHLEQHMSGNFIGVVDNFERESDLERKTWQECCEESIIVMQDIPMGICPIIRWRTAMNWVAHF
eukprot:4536042-Ditylum_brightwellii.AAC.1